MRAPAFWWRPPGIAARLLQPAGWAYGRAASLRLGRPGFRVGIPVICVGNVTVGGAGKTPTAIAVAALLRELGRTPSFLTRGYRGRLAGPVRVEPGKHGPADVGDEALLLARHAVTVVARARPDGGNLCRTLGADAIVMDDGLQNPSLAKDLSLAVFDAGVGIGNGSVLPAGPLRAPLARQWPLIDAVIVIGEGRPGERIAADARDRGLPVLSALIAPEDNAAAAVAGRRVLAFAGIGRPEKFFDTLRACGAVIVEERAFPDHHAYTFAEISRLLSVAERRDLLAVTTEKDRVRLVRLERALPAIAGIATLPVAVRFRQPDEIRRVLAAAVARFSAG